MEYFLISFLFDSLTYCLSRGFVGGYDAVMVIGCEFFYACLDFLFRVEQVAVEERVPEVGGRMPCVLVSARNAGRLWFVSCRGHSIHRKHGAWLEIG